MKSKLAGPDTKRSRWWPFNLRSVQIAILAVAVLYTINYIVALLFPGTQV
ncbi:MAG TPA: hypothetical protein VNF26_12280 [Candidatus Baltobacterales bacterium]|nr:hypothetical protein [Candidatus Baltobacterales bacterium]